MTDMHRLISGYLDEMLTDEEFDELVDWIHATPMKSLGR